MKLFMQSLSLIAANLFYSIIRGFPVIVVAPDNERNTTNKAGNERQKYLSRALNSLWRILLYSFFFLASSRRRKIPSAIMSKLIRSCRSLVEISWKSPSISHSPEITFSFPCLCPITVHRKRAPERTNNTLQA